MLLSFGALVAAFALWLPRWSAPGRPLPGYALFLLCLVPYGIWLVRLVLARGGAEPSALAVQAGVVLAATFPLELRATHGRYWDYFQDRDALLGARLGGVPVEEFAFYPLFLSLALLLYLLFCARLRARGLPELRVDRRRLRTVLVVFAGGCLALAGVAWRRRGGGDLPPVHAWDGWNVPHFAEGPLAADWTVTCLAALGAILILLSLAEGRTPVRLRAVLPATGIFVLLGLSFDLLGVSRGWWVYNAQAVSGWWIGPLPAENLAMYLCGVPETASLFEVARSLLGERGTA